MSAGGVGGAGGVCLDGRGGVVNDAVCFFRDLVIWWDNKFSAKSFQNLFILTTQTTVLKS